MGPRLCLAVAWAAWTIKPALNRNDEGPGFLPGLFSCPEATQNAPKWSPNPKRAFAEIERPRTTRRGARAPLLVLITARPEFRAPWSTRARYGGHRVNFMRGPVRIGRVCSREHAAFGDLKGA